MKQVKLYTGDGAYVFTVKLPAFQQMPDAIHLGERTFFRQDDQVYTEGFLYVLPIAQEHLS